MFDRFTDRARKVMSFARQEAERFNHDYIGTVHILLGLLKEGSGVAANVLTNMEVDLEKVRQEVEKQVNAAPKVGNQGRFPFTPRAKKVLEFAIDEARELGHDYLGTEHLLLGLIRVQNGIAAKSLQDFGVNLEDVRIEVRKFLGVLPDRLKQLGVAKTTESEFESPQAVPPESHRSLALVLQAEPELLTALGDAQGLAKEFKHDSTRTEHLLLGLLQDDNGFTAEVLTHFGLKLEDVRNEILRRIKAR